MFFDIRIHIQFSVFDLGALVFGVKCTLVHIMLVSLFKSEENEVTSVLTRYYTMFELIKRPQQQQPNEPVAHSDDELTGA